MLDRNKEAGHVQGEGVGGARFYQDGHYYGAAGEYLFSNPGLPPPAGVKVARTMEQAEQALQQRVAAQATGGSTPVAAPSSQPSSPSPSSPQLPPATTESGEPLTREQRLMQMNVPQLQEVQMAALKASKPEADEKDLRGELIKGPGSKSKLVVWLLENTADE